MPKNESITLRCCEGNTAMSPMPKKLSFAMSYVPFQCYKTTYSNEEALANGTLFPELDKPFLGGGADD